MTRAVGSDVILNSQVAQALAVIGDRWAFLVIRDVYQGVRQFEALRRLRGAARGTLASRLKTLVKNGILYKNPYRDSPVRYEYRLTDKGLDLYPVVLMIWSWETTWGQACAQPRALIHTGCGHSMHPRYRCRHCHVALSIRDVTYSVGRNPAPAQKVPPRFHRRSKRPAVAGGARQRSMQYLDIIGDRWTALVVAAAFFGLRRYDQILDGIGIATNILSDRLKLLVDAGVLKRSPYQDKPVRYEYHLSAKGRDIYASTVAMHEWANRWIIGKGEQPIKLRHKCGEAFESEVVCDACDKLLVPSEVRGSDA